MSARRETTPPAERITLDQIVHRAEEVKAMAVTDVKSSVAEVLDSNETRTLLMVAGLVVFAASMAFYLGSRAGKRFLDADR
jgi:hypothetical protein